MKELFTNRKAILNLFSENGRRIKKGIGENIALIGPRRIGKTLVLKKHLSTLSGETEILPVYLNSQQIISSPEIFARRYIALIAYYFAKKMGMKPDIELFFDPISFYGECPRLGSEVITRYAKILLESRGKREADQHYLYGLAWGFPEKLAEEQGIRILMIIDEFQDIAKLNLFPQIKDALSIMRGYAESQEHVSYIASGSIVSMMEDIFESSSQPFFAQFRVERLGHFIQKDTALLAEKIFKIEGLQYERGVLNKLHLITYGHPFYIHAVCLKSCELARLLNGKITLSLIEKAFVHSVVSVDGKINLLCDYIYSSSLGRVKGETMLQTVMQVLAREEGLTLSEIARAIGRKTGEVSIHLKSLLKSDMLVSSQKRYYFRDPVLRFWLAKTNLGIEVDYYDVSKAVMDLSQEFLERYQRVSSELGIAQESHIREMIRRFSGQRIEGKLFGVKKEIVLPHFKSVKPYLSSDGQTELDGLAENDKKWAIEVKWRNKLAGEKELRDFHQKATGVADVYWYISKNGFTKEAVLYAKHKDIFFSSFLDVQKIAKCLKFRWK